MSPRVKPRPSTLSSRPRSSYAEYRSARHELLDNAQPTLYGRPVVVVPDLPTSAANARSAIFGDISAAYTVRRVTGLGLQRLERQDVDKSARVVHVARTHVEGMTKAYGKTSASVREVPLSAVAIAALDDVPPRLDTRLVFYGPRGAHVNLRNFRRREWHPALEAAGIEPRRIYDLRSNPA